MRNLLWLAAILALVGWAYALRQQLQTARQRGDMYRDISVRLERRVAEMTQVSH